MKQQPTSIAVSQELSVSRWADFLSLIKVRLSSLVVFTAVMGYIIVVGLAVDPLILCLITVGGFAITAAANAFNQVLEKDYDRLMERTENRPLATGRMKTSEAVFLAGMLCLIGVTALSAINPIAGTLGMSSMILYAFVYTPMKRYSPVSVWIGGIPGALPVTIGCVAAQGEVTSLAIGLFVLQYLWQLPHFWAIGYLAFEDYQKAGFKLLPVRADNIHPALGLHSFVAAVAMIATLGVMYAIGDITAFLLAAAGILTSVYVFFSFRFYQRMERATALKLMFSSFIYLPVVLVLFWIL